MTWLIRLYPPAWRQRYGRELAELLAAQPMSFRTAVDLVAGAVDAWLNPQSSTAVTTTDAKGAGAMLPKMLQLRSGGYGPTVTSADNRKAAAVTIGGTLALVIPLTWATARYGNDPYVFSYLFSFMTVSWLLPVAFSELNDSDVHAIDQQPAGAFVTQIVPAEVDSPYVLRVNIRRHRDIWI